MAQRIPWPKSRAVTTAAGTAGRQFDWLWSRESMLRLILSAVLATALWLYVTNKQEPGYFDFGQPIPVKTANLGGDLIVTNQLANVKIRYRSSNPNLYVTPTNFQAYVDLQGFKAGSYNHVPIKVTGDAGISVIKATPRFATVVIDQMKTKQVPVVLRESGKTPAGYQAGAASVTPNSVTVKGPARIVSQVAEARVFVPLGDQRTSISEPQAPVLDDSQGLPVSIPTFPSGPNIGRTLIQVTPLTVRVRVPIKETSSFKTVPVTARTSGRPKTGYGLSSLLVQPAEITVEGPPKVLARMEYVSTQAISVAGKGAGKFRKTVPLRLPEGVSSGVKKVTVHVTLQPVAASSTTQVGVVPANIPPSLIVHTHPATVLVTLLGSSAHLAQATRSTTAVLNLANYGVGTYDITPVVKKPNGFTVLHVSPRTVTVTLTARQ